MCATVNSVSHTPVLGGNDAIIHRQNTKSAGTIKMPTKSPMHT